MKGIRPHNAAHERQQLLNRAEEKTVVEFVLELSDLGECITLDFSMQPCSIFCKCALVCLLYYSARSYAFLSNGSTDTTIFNPLCTDFFACLILLSMTPIFWPTFSLFRPARCVYSHSKSHITNFHATPRMVWHARASDSLLGGDALARDV